MTFKVIILSQNPANLLCCVRALQTNEPDLLPEQIIVVDDGARKEAEAHLPGIRWIEGDKPFVFARNVNLGIEAAADSDIILLHDDAQLQTPNGFTNLSKEIRQRQDIGIASPAINGIVGNPRQQVTEEDCGFQLESDALVFICVYITRVAYDLTGPLDERFVGYGMVDFDFSHRTLRAGLQLGIWNGCIVDHSDASTSTYRTKVEFNDLFKQNKLLYEEKVRENRMIDNLPVDLLYLAWNRLEFTKETFTTLLSNTDWQYVQKLFVFDDGSQDGTGEWLENQIRQVPVKTCFVSGTFGSHVAALSHFIDLSDSPILAKVDNDAMVPPGWLHQSLSVFDRHPELSLLGIEALYPINDDPFVERSFTPSASLDGLGLFRRQIFGDSRPTPFNTYYGFAEWIEAQKHIIVCGWLTPAISVFLLDRLPFEPWKSLSASYIERGWQRHSYFYSADNTMWHWRWPL